MESHGMSEFPRKIFPNGIPWGIKPGRLFCRIAACASVRCRTINPLNGYVNNLSGHCRSAWEKSCRTPRAFASIDCAG